MLLPLSGRPRKDAIFTSVIKSRILHLKKVQFCIFQKLTFIIEKIAVLYISKSDFNN